MSRIVHCCVSRQCCCFTTSAWIRFHSRSISLKRARSFSAGAVPPVHFEFRSLHIAAQCKQATSWLKRQLVHESKVDHRLTIGVREQPIKVAARRRNGLAAHPPAARDPHHASGSSGVSAALSEMRSVAPLRADHLQRRKSDRMVGSLRVWLLRPGRIPAPHAQVAAHNGLVRFVRLTCAIVSRGDEVF